MTTDRDRLADIAEHIYLDLYGAYDDTRFRDDMLAEIEDWLTEADRPDEVIALVDAGRITDLEDEWNAYQAQANDRDDAEGMAMRQRRRRDTLDTPDDLPF